MNRAILRLARCVAAAVCAVGFCSSIVVGQPSGNWGDGQPPVYQRHAFERDHRYGDKGRRHFGHRHHFATPQVNSGWFQRPYPYHLDYYKMRYGGSYAPYFGNLYGPPEVVTAPPYFGPYGADFGGYSGYGYGQPGFGAYQQPGAPPEQLPLDDDGAVIIDGPGGAGQSPAP